LNYLNDKKIIYKRCKTHELVISISEYVLLQILCWERNLEDYNRISHDGNWDWSRRNNYHFRSLKQIKVGIVGNGFIGSGVSNYLKNLGLHIYHINVGNRIRSVDYNMLGAVDYLTLHLPLSTETEQCIGSSLFSAMKKNAVLINTSRGKIINETELCTAIKNGDIRGASLDVVSEEPLLNSSIIKNNNRIVLSPHIAGRSESALMALVYEIVENISIWVNV
jgi:phosphoglycerate dehydrogenase-like enzyme